MKFVKEDLLNLSNDVEPCDEMGLHNAFWKYIILFVRRKTLTKDKIGGKNFEREN